MTRLGLVLVATASCGGYGGGEPLDGPPRDAPPPCAAQTLALGRCVTDLGAPCTGTLGEPHRYQPASAGAEIPLVLGPQGSSMLIFAAQTDGIRPGDPADPANPSNPQIEIVVSRAGVEVAVYRGRSGFADQDGHQVAASLFVITEDSSLDGIGLQAHGEVIDSQGARRCGDLSFVARR